MRSQESEPWRYPYFPNSTIDQLIACQSYEQALQFLEEKGWDDTESSGDAEKILTREEEKIWEVVKDLSIGMEHFDRTFLSEAFS